MANGGWVLAANIVADLSAWCRMPGLYDHDDFKNAERDTLQQTLAPARPACAPRLQARPGDQPDLAVDGRLPGLLAAAMRLPDPPDQPPLSPRPGRSPAPGVVGAGTAPSASAAPQPAGTC